jgi:hypothetical protein
MYGSKPTGLYQSYSYFITHAKVNEQKVHIPTSKINKKIPGWLAGIAVNPELIPALREIYKNQMKRITQDDKEGMLLQVKQKLASPNEEEARLGRLYISGKISEQTYDQLRIEWQEKSINFQVEIKELEFHAGRFIDDLEVALVLMTNLSTLFS